MKPNDADNPRVVRGLYDLGFLNADTPPYIGVISVVDSRDFQAIRILQRSRPWSRDDPVSARKNVRPGDCNKAKFLLYCGQRKAICPRFCRVISISPCRKRPSVRSGPFDLPTNVYGSIHHLHLNWRLIVSGHTHRNSLREASCHWLGEPRMTLVESRNIQDRIHIHTDRFSIHLFDE
jgi:hypothetical protein